MPEKSSEVRCSRCSEKDPPLFYKDSSRGSGFSSRCRECLKKIVKAKHAANPEPGRQRAAAWSRANPEKAEQNHKKSRTKRTSKIKSYGKQWREENPKKLREKRLKKYNLTLSEYETLLASQGAVCKICRQPESRHDTALSVDHCHISGKVRGLLCNGCNRGIGYLKDSYDVVLSAAQYLKAAK